jgi:hypothetical protein
MVDPLQLHVIETTSYFFAVVVTAPVFDGEVLAISEAFDGAALEYPS